MLKNRKITVDLGKSLKVLFLTGVSIACIVIVFPYYWTIVSSIQSKSLFSWPPELFPTKFSFNSYLEIFHAKPLALWLKNSLIVAMPTAAVCVITSALAAYSLSRFKYKGGSAVLLLILTSQMLPAPLLLIPLFIVFQHLHLLNSFIGLVIVNVAFTIPFSTLLMKGFFDGIPLELEEAAQIDGCTKLGSLIRVTLPLSLPGVMATYIFGFIVAWGEYFAAATLIIDESKWVGAVGLSTFIGEYAIEWGPMMAAAIIFSLPPIILFICLQRYFISGLTAGSVKG